MGNQILRISDGTTTINLIDPARYGFHLQDWQPQIVKPKGGGVFADNPMTDGRRLVYRVYDNASDTFELAVNSSSQGNVIMQTRKLFQLLEKAVMYWITGWQNTPVWIEARASCETYSRYATIINYGMGELNNPFVQPFFNTEDQIAMVNLVLVIEREHWRSVRPDTAPGSLPCLEIASQMTYKSVSLGRSAVCAESVYSTDTTDDEVFIATAYSKANLSHIYQYDASAISFSPNLLTMAVPYELLPNPVANGDIAYFGCRTGVADSGHFSSLVFHIPTAGNYTIVWEYWNGAWVSLSASTDFVDHTSGLTKNTGDSDVVFWVKPVDWATTAINGITAYWVRARVTAVTDSTPPQQTSRHVYSPTNPFVTIASDQINGDIPALAKISMRTMWKTVPAYLAAPKRLIIFGRSTERNASGYEFSPYLPAADEQLPTGITTNAIGGTSTSFVNDSTLSSTAKRGPVDRIVLYNPAGVQSLLDRFYWELDSGSYRTYQGTYRVYIRYHQQGGVDFDFSVRFKAVVGSTLNPMYTNTVKLLTQPVASLEYGPGIAYLGTIDLSVPVHPSETLRSLALYLQLSNSNGAPGDLFIYDLILIPTDDLLIDLSSDVEIAYSFREIIDIDSGSVPNNDRRSFIYQGVSPYDGQAVQRISWDNPNRAQLNTNQGYRIFTLGISEFSSYDFEAADFDALYEVSIAAVPRYLGMIGDSQ